MSPEKPSIERGSSSFVGLTAKLMKQNRPQTMVNVALVFIFIVDAFLTAFNMVHRVLVKLGIVRPTSEGWQSVPPAFSPTNPPPFAQWPGIHIYCRFVHLYNVVTGYNEELRLHHELFSRKPQNDWIRDWAYWEGIGHKGEWGSPFAPSDKDSRSPCPGLNILATHGIVHRSGSKISGSKMVAGLSRAFNISPTMAMQLYTPLFPVFADNGHIFDLDEIGIMNIIEHDASLLRPDFYMADWKHDPIAMSRPHQDLIDRWFPSASNSKSKASEQEAAKPLQDEARLSDADFAQALSIRRSESKKLNKMYSSTVKQSLIGAGSCCLMLNVFGGHVEDLREMAGTVQDDLIGVRSTEAGHSYGYERIPNRRRRIAKVASQASAVSATGQGWQPATADRYFGMTIFEALWTTFKIEMKARS